MKMGKDGNQYYVSCGGCLGDPRSRFVFADTLEQAIDTWNEKYPRNFISLNSILSGNGEV